MLVIIGGIILFIVACAMPTHVQTALLIINLFLPDPLPFADEIIQIAALLTSMIVKAKG